MEIQFFIAGPDILRSLAQKLLKPAVRAFLAEGQVIDSREAVEIHIFIINTIFQGIIPKRNQACDLGPDADSAGEFQNADPLVALGNIEMVHKFHGDDGLPDSLIDMGLIQVGPFHRELCIVREQGQKIAGEGMRPAGCPGADHGVQRNLLKPQGHLRGDIGLADEILQSRKIGNAALQKLRTIGFLSPLPGFDIRHNIHKNILP